MRKNRVPKLILCALLAAVLLLGACAKEDISENIANFYAGKGIDARVSLKMTYNSKLSQYVIDQSFKDENSHFVIVEPEILKGIEADIAPDGAITFAGIALAPESMPEGFSVFSLLHAAARALSSSQASDWGEAEEGFMVSRELYMGDKVFRFDEWFDASYKPLKFEMFLNGERVLEGEYTEFETK